MVRRMLVSCTLVLGVGAPPAAASPTLVDVPSCAGCSYVRIFGDERNPDRLKVTVGPRSVTVSGSARINTRRLDGQRAICRRRGSRSVVCPAPSRNRVFLYLPLYAGNDSVELRGTGPRRKVQILFYGSGGNDRLVSRIPVEPVRANDTCVEGSTGNDSFSVPVRRRNAPVCNLEGGAGDDVLSGESADGGAGKDRLTGTKARDELTGGAGDDRLVGRGGDDALDAGSGRDVLDGGAGDDGFSGGAGDDLLQGGDGDDRLFGDGGTDSYDAGAGADRIGTTDADGDGRDPAADFAAEGNLEPEGVSCGAGDDRVIGSDRADVLAGCELAEPFDDAPLPPSAIVAPASVTVRGRCPASTTVPDPCPLRISLRAAGPAASEAARAVYGSARVDVPRASTGVDVTIPLSTEGQRLLAQGPLAVFVDHAIEGFDIFGGFGLALTR